MKLKQLILASILSVLTLLSIGCGPIEKEMVVEIGPSQTAYLVALEKDSQGKFESIEYLETQKVASKRIMLPQRKQVTGRGWGNYRYIPTARVIMVDRAPVSRKWTGDRNSTTEGNNVDTNASTSPLEVESLDSIGFAVGVTITARIDEKDASMFLYYNAGRQLSEVIDTNIKSFILARLSEEFGAVPLSACRLQKNRIFNLVEKEATDFFKKRGITLEYMGLSEGLTYLNVDIQAAIDASFKAEQDKITAQQEQEAQTIRNKTLVAKVTAESQAANQLAQNLNAALAKQRLEIEVMKAKALATMAEKWNGALPANVIPSDNPLMGMFFSAAKK
jgi:hypothetical protein